jgi:radical SAM protein with 4Fe4S-binding SPASM domain
MKNLNTKKIQLGQYDVRKKLTYNFSLIADLKKEKRPFPFSMSIYPSNICNHSCNFCEVEQYLKSNHQLLSLELVDNILNQMKALNVKSIQWSGGGEPLLNKNVYKMISISSKNGFKNGLITNLSILKHDKIEELVNNLQWIRISFNGGTELDYKKIHAVGDFYKVINNIKKIIEINKIVKNSVNISLSFVYKKDNYQSLIDIAELCLELGVDSLHIRPDQFIEDVNWLSSNEMADVLDRVLSTTIDTNLKITTSEYLDKNYLNKYPSKCLAHFTSTVIQADGEVSFCRSRVRDDGPFNIGNIKENTLQEIWDSNLNRSIEDTLHPKECAGVCRQMHVNVYLEDILKQSNELDSDFI